MLFFVSFLGFCIMKIRCCNDTLVHVQQGWLSGERLNSVTGDLQYYSFKGIPYAKAPVGTLRFKAPQPPEPWKGIRNASAHGSVCPQLDIFKNELIPSSEDCLFLNVYSPNLKPIALLPVIFFIHGGLFKSGSGNDDFYGPDFLVAKHVVVVTINYRMDALGFLSLGTKEVPGNAGLKDQVLALKWVKKNIKSFGGSPCNVTIMGQSAGGASVALHMVSPMSKSLFQRAILQSGVPNMDAFIAYKPEDRAFILGKTLGFETDNTSELLIFLQKIKHDKLINTTCTVLASEEITNILFRLTPFTPVYEKDCGQKRFLIEDPFISLESRRVRNVDVMFSYNTHEGLILLPFYTEPDFRYIQRFNRYPEMFVPSKILLSAPPDVILHLGDQIRNYYFGNKTVSVKNMPEFINYADFGFVVYDVHRFFRRLPEFGSRYFYKFSSYSSRNYIGLKGARYGIFGASHLDDLFYIFDPKSLNMPLTKESIEYKMIQLITSVITNFAKYGNPNPNSSLGVTWPEFNNTSLAYVEVTDKLVVGYAPDDEDIQFWKSVFEYAGMTF